MSESTSPAATPAPAAPAAPAAEPITPTPITLEPTPTTIETTVEPAAPATEASNPEGFKPVDQLSNQELSALTADPAKYAAYEKWLAEQGNAAAPAESTPEPTTQEPPAEDPDPDLEGGKKSRLRIGFLPENQRLQVNSVVQLMRAEPGISLEEATARITGKTLAEFGAAPAAPAAEPITPTPKADAVAEIDTKIADVRAKLKEAKSNFDSDAELDLLDQLSDLKVEKQMAAFRAEQLANAEAQTAETKFETDYQGHVSKAHEMFPDGLNPDSVFSRTIAQELQRLDQAKSPLLDDPEYPLVLAYKVAARLGIAPKVAGSPSPAAPAATLPAPVPAPSRAAREVPPTVGPTAPAGTPMTRETAMASIDSMPLAELERVAAALEPARK